MSAGCLGYDQPVSSNAFAFSASFIDDRPAQPVSQAMRVPELGRSPFHKNSNLHEGAKNL
jgi:hypothetical protein